MRSLTVLTLTDNASTEIRRLMDQPEVPDGGGLRIANDPAGGGLTVTLAAGPADGDAVVDDAGARVFLEAQAAELLEDKALDAGVGSDGQLQFALAPQST
jgi:Fe-S cluster assembly iron-binding protein IscA